MVGDGSYLMMNSEIATSVMLGVSSSSSSSTMAASAASTDCKRPPAARLQQSVEGCAARGAAEGRFRRPRARLGAEAVKVSIAELEAAFAAARAADHPGDRHRHRSDLLDRRGRGLVGCRRAGGVDARRSWPRAASYEKALETQRVGD